MPCVSLGADGVLLRLTDVSTIAFWYIMGWLGSRLFSVLDSGPEWPGFKSQSRLCRVTVLGKLFTPIVPLSIEYGLPFLHFDVGTRPSVL